eukprot:gb/GEZN01020837.1/.p1 GENE.gb/GEZN01020837.1/~~gb/GEZN01020837.1/.p1  ORF type:complete len:215 (-),score=33.81 gb/GEZN01020837.1/:27-644(-)
MSASVPPPPDMLSGCGAFLLTSDPVHINAPIDIVWTSLLDVKKYPEWNPFHRKIVTDLKEGEKWHMWVDWKLRMHSDPVRDRLMLVPAKLFKLDHEKHLVVYEHTWYVGCCIFTTAKRIQILVASIDAEGEEGTDYYSWDPNGGCLAWLVNCLYTRKMDRCFRAQMSAFKDHVEKLWEGSRYVSSAVDASGAYPDLRVEAEQYEL